MTAVEFLKNELRNRYSLDNSEPLFQQALEMEKQQIIEACNSQRNDYKGMPTYNKSGEQYYNETYKKD
jgi:hypothetical protein